MLWLYLGYGWLFVAGVFVTLLLVGRVRAVRRIYRTSQWGALIGAFIASAAGFALSIWGMHPVGAPWFVWDGLLWRLLAFIPGLVVGGIIAHVRWQRGAAHGYND